MATQISLECGEIKRISKRIINGKTAPRGSHPWFAAFFKVENNDEEDLNLPYCGGVIINQHYVLTAAHCIFNKRLSDMRVAFEFYELDKYGMVPDMKLYKVAEKITHPKFDDHPKSPKADIGLIRLAEPIQFSSSIKPICLPNSDQINFTELIAVGWGRIHRTGDRPETLQQVPLPQDDGNCEMWYDKKFLDDHICARDGKAKGWGDVCNGDSGGPLIGMDQTKHATLAGLVSYSTCLGIPAAVFTRVSYYLDWIDEHTKGTSFCKPFKKY